MDDPCLERCGAMAFIGPEFGRFLIMAADLKQVEQRLTAVETSLAEVRHKLGLAASPGNWVEALAGSLADISEDDYQQYLACCRDIRSGGPASAAEEPGP